jgi:hypothetical protein
MTEDQTSQQDPRDNTLSQSSPSRSRCTRA